MSSQRLPGRVCGIGFAITDPLPTGTCRKTTCSPVKQTQSPAPEAPIAKPRYAAHRRPPLNTFITLGIILLIVAIILYALGARGTAGMTAGIGKFILIIGIVIFLILVVVGLLNRAG